MGTTKRMPYVCLYEEYLESFLVLSDQAVGKLIKGLMAYLCTGEEPQLKGAERVLWPNLRDKLNRDQKAYIERCEINRINGAKGGKAKKKTTDDKQTLSDGKGSQTKQANQNHNQNQNHNHNQNQNQSQNQNQNQNPTEEENTGEKLAAKPPCPRFSKPSVEQIRQYCQEMGYSLDPEAIWDFYESKGWKVGNTPMKDWKAAVRTWMRKEKEHGKHNKQPALEKIVLPFGHDL